MVDGAGHTKLDIYTRRWNGSTGQAHEMMREEHSYHEGGPDHREDSTHRLDASR